MDKSEEERWIEFETCRLDEEEDEHANVAVDLFADPDPYVTIPFTFEVPFSCCNTNDDDDDLDDDDNHHDASTSTTTKSTREVAITLKGFKHEHERIFDSTGLTLWRASKILCDYLCNNTHLIKGKNVLELGAGLGLCGLLTYHLNPARMVMTDGDTDVLVEMRYNVDSNLTSISKNNVVHSSQKNNENDEGNEEICNKDNNMVEKPSEVLLPCKQLRWGHEYVDSFKKFVRSLESKNSSSKEETNEVDVSFDIIIASDIIYVDYILDDLFDTVVDLLSTSQHAKFVLGYARRAVDINQVFECAERHGLKWTKPADQVEGIYIFSRSS